jgi:phage terminase large subunit-like protein
LLGEVIEEQEGALWTRAMVDQAQTVSGTLPPDLVRIVVGVDPAITATAMSSLCGIVVAGIDVGGHAHVLEDLSGRYSPDKWARIVVKAYDDHAADRIVAEGNQGGELVRINLKTVRPNLPVRIVHARHSKQARAEPVAALYEQGKVSHLKPMPELEDQLCTWVPLSGDPSPDRLDAMVWALTDLMLKGVTKQKFVAPVVVGMPRYWPGSGPMDY